MMTSTNQLEQLARAIAASKDHHFLPCGGLTKPGLTVCDSRTEKVDMSVYQGILAYDPTEFLITARAGTRVVDLQAALAEHGQYLPCDPLFGQAGATLGGTLASGISGSNRLLYGGLRDFVMEVELIDGLGALIRGGGKVVKNAAGFDVPKLVVGSYGRLGIITEVTFKVFPKPGAFSTLSVTCEHLAQAVELSQKLLAKPLPIAALDFACNVASDASETSVQLLIRCGAPANSLPAVLARVQELIGRPGSVLDGPADTELWEAQASFVEQPPQQNESVLRLATHPGQLIEFERQLRPLASNVSIRITGGGSATWLRFPSAQLAELDECLRKQKIAGIILASDAHDPLARLGLGDVAWRDVANRIQRALDPQGRYLTY